MTQDYWTTEISPNTYAKGLGLRELWQKKYLIWLAVAFVVFAAILLLIIL
jgi:hypothetical protein